ncbi:6139_t:CDS:2 [Ambispora gerdemannii]|uniref:6139_t:CDS:1 n=1 Tax=Ambispora gerdemannii TaxID=144530 RepID=A0A9N9F142_9GLOM|nr:6139_t:CDS:2 [Ambispora gerdemannii]
MNNRLSKNLNSIQKPDLKDRYCSECRREWNINLKLCPTCDIKTWTSEDTQIDEFIHEQQLNCKNFYDWFEGISYEQFTEVKFIKDFQNLKISIAKWTNGPVTDIYENTNGDKKFKRAKNSFIQLSEYLNIEYFYEQLKVDIPEKTYHRRKLAISRNPITQNYILITELMYCRTCLQKLNAEIWKCPICDFPSWTSGDKKIDEYLIEAQRNLNKAEWPIWIPFNRFRDIEHIAVGGFGKVSKATWERPNEDPDILTVALKEIFDSRNYNLDLINESQIQLDDLWNYARSEIKEFYSHEMDEDIKSRRIDFLKSKTELKIAAGAIYKSRPLTLMIQTANSISVSLSNIERTQYTTKELEIDNANEETDKSCPLNAIDEINETDKENKEITI